jgi:ABC-type cobalt transport system substrate-binding protein
MRKYLALSVIGVCLLVLAPATSAFAGSSTYYAGTNSQGQKLLFSVDQTSSGPRFDPFFTTMVERCPATGETITIGFSFSGFEIPIKNGKFTFTLNDIQDRFLWSGTITPKSASGPESYAMPAFDNEGGLQACTTGSLSWKAMALTAGSAKPTAPKTAYTVKISKASNGSVSFSFSH